MHNLLLLLLLRGLNDVARVDRDLSAPAFNLGSEPSRICDDEIVDIVFRNDIRHMLLLLLALRFPIASFRSMFLE